MNDVALLALALLGAALGAAVALVPGLHVYNLAGLALVLASREMLPWPGESLAMLLIGLVTGWTVVNVIPSVFLFAPDDAGAVAVLPATRMLLRGRDLEAALLVGAGSLAGLLALVAVSPLLDEALRPIRQIIAPHTGWMLAAVIAFMLVGEWPRSDMRAPSPWRRLLSAWSYLGAGLLTFVLSGVLGLVLMFRSPIPVDAAFQNLMPAFVGLFTIPGLLQIALLGVRPPAQSTAWPASPAPYPLLRGALTGVAGGLFASVLPVVTGGIGGLLAGHATAQRDDRLFLISQGGSKAAYYIGSLLLLFVPGLGLTRGGMAWMLTTVYVPYGWRSYWLAVAAVALCGALSFVLLMLLARGAAALAGRIDARLFAWPALAAALAITAGFTGLGGLAVAAVASCIGMIPVLAGGRRLNCLGVLLAPITLNVIGIGPQVAHWLGL